MKLQRLSLGSGLVAVLFLLSACKTHRVEHAPEAPPYEPSNVYGIPELPEELVRVAVLPVFWAEDAEAPFLLDLDRVVHTELVRTRLFEAVALSRAELARLIGRKQVASYQALPAELLPVLLEQGGFDGILLTDLTVYDPYRPLAVGLRMKLLSLHDLEILWSFDEVLDAGNPQVASGALAFASTEDARDYPVDRSAIVLQSPSRFGAYAAYTAFRTLPSR